MDQAGVFVGLILRHQLITILNARDFKHSPQVPSCQCQYSLTSVFYSRLELFLQICAQVFATDNPHHTVVVVHYNSDMKCKPSLGSFRVGYSPTTRCLKPIVRNKRNTRVKGDCSWITNGHGFMSNRRKVSYSSSCFSFCLTWSHVNVKIEQIL